MLKQLDTIILYKGATSAVEFDFTEFEFAPNTHCLLTIKKMNKKETVYTYEFNESKKYVVEFTDEFTAELDRREYWYDIMYIVGEERYPQCSPSGVIVEEVIGSYEYN